MPLVLVHRPLGEQRAGHAAGRAECNRTVSEVESGEGREAAEGAVAAAPPAAPPAVAMLGVARPGGVVRGDVERRGRRDNRCLAVGRAGCDHGTVHHLSRGECDACENKKRPRLHLGDVRDSGTHGRRLRPAAAAAVDARHRVLIFELGRRGGEIDVQHARRRRDCNVRDAADEAGRREPPLDGQLAQQRGSRRIAHTPRLCHHTGEAAAVLGKLLHRAEHEQHATVQQRLLRGEDFKAAADVELGARDDGLGVGGVGPHDDELAAAHRVDVRAVVLDQVRLVDALHLHVGRAV
mmetsp:Transcript_10075/g.20361  ORF Transcript_10075/g.20361 Transcript_10075/m.20361 type:complete len:294 (-) Transcript_10075:475-1356(-)